MSVRAVDYLTIDLTHDDPVVALVASPVGSGDAATTISVADAPSWLDREQLGTYVGRILLRSIGAAHAAGRIYRIAKRAADAAVAIVLLLLLLPVLVVCALAVRVTSRGPVLYRHRRHGVGGAEFMMLKFRSMIDGADTMISEMEELASRGEVESLDELVFKAPDDPRVTRVGRFLRRTNLDEIPQLLNVLAGQMSLVGPRPLVTDEIEALSEAVRDQRLSVRPGVTGLWQVTRTEETTFLERIALDVLYVERRSALLDTMLVATTPLAVLRGTRSH